MTTVKQDYGGGGTLLKLKSVTVTLGTVKRGCGTCTSYAAQRQLDLSLIPVLQITRAINIVFI